MSRKRNSFESNKNGGEQTKRTTSKDYERPDLRTHSNHLSSRSKPKFIYSSDITNGETRKAQNRHHGKEKRKYVREVVCPNCDLKVWTHSIDVINCRRCNLNYVQEYEPHAHGYEKSRSSPSRKPKPMTSVSRRTFLNMKCRHCKRKQIVYSVPGEAFRCKCGGVMVWDDR